MVRDRVDKVQGNLEISFTSFQNENQNKFTKIQTIVLALKEDN